MLGFPAHSNRLRPGQIAPRGPLPLEAPRRPHSLGTRRGVSLLSRRPRRAFLRPSGGLDSQTPAGDSLHVISENERASAKRPSPRGGSHQNWSQPPGYHRAPHSNRRHCRQKRRLRWKPAPTTRPAGPCGASVLGPLVSARLEHGDRQAHLREISARTHLAPDGSAKRLSRRTLEGWRSSKIRSRIFSSSGMSDS